MVPPKGSPARRRLLKKIASTNFKTPNNPYQHWSVKEKQAILKGLKQYGGSDLSKLASVVATKSVEEIERFIEGRKRRIANSSTATRAPIDLWLDKAQRNTSNQYDYSKGLTEAVSNSHQNGYHDVYEFITHLLKGDSPPELVDVSGSVLLALLEDLATLLKSLDMEKLMIEVKEYQNSGSSSTLPAIADDDSLFKFYEEGATGTTDIEDLNSFNPLKLPPSLLGNVSLSVGAQMRNLIDTRL